MRAHQIEAIGYNVERLMGAVDWKLQAAMKLALLVRACDVRVVPTGKGRNLVALKRRDGRPT